MKQLSAFLPALFLILMGCHPSQRELESADYGEYPERYEDIVKAFYQDYADYPEGIRYERISVPITMYWGTWDTKFRYGWRVCATVIYRNGVRKTDALFIKKDHVIEYLPDALWHGKNVCTAQRS
jgi:hypothetical protein